MNRLYRPFIEGVPAAALMVLRLIAGAGIFLHGLPKIQNPFSWMGPGMPAPLQALAALSEAGGGLAWILGLLTPIASFGIMCTMAVAAGLVHISKGDPFVAPRDWEGGSWEMAALYFGIAAVLMLVGPGRFSLDYLLFGRRAAAEEARTPATA